MARFTSAYSSFCSSLDEVSLLRSRALRLEVSDPVRNGNEIDALCRGSVVLLSSHLEAYIKELGELLILRLFSKCVDRNKLGPVFFYHISKEHIERIKDASDPGALAAALFEFIDADFDYWSQMGPFPVEVDAERFNRGFSNPTFKKIKKYFNRFGFQEYERSVAQSLRSDFQPYVNMVNHLVETRNAIAHGDPTARKTPKEIGDMKNMIQSFSRCTDIAFADWCREVFCAIR